jgi:hypothetical protein
MRLKIAEYAVEHGNAKASREFNAPKSTVSFMVKELLAARQKSEIVQELPATKAGQPLLIANWDAVVFKKQQRDSFSSWYAQDLKTKLDNGLNVEDVKMCLRLSVVKPLHAEWVITTMPTSKKKKEVGQQGFRLAGILDCFEAILADMQPL